MAVHGLGGHEVLHLPVGVEEVVAVVVAQHIVVVRGAVGVDGRQDGLDPRVGDGTGGEPRIEVGVVGGVDGLVRLGGHLAPVEVGQSGVDLKVAVGAGGGMLNMHKSYAAKGRNHLSASYEQDILALPETPQEGRRGK